MFSPEKKLTGISLITIFRYLKDVVWKSDDFCLILEGGAGQRQNSDCKLQSVQSQLSHN